MSVQLALIQTVVVAFGIFVEHAALLLRSAHTLVLVQVVGGLVLHPNHRDVEAVETFVVLEAHVRALRYEKLEKDDIVSEGSPHERRAPSRPRLTIDIGALGEQHQHHRLVIVVRRSAKRRGCSFHERCICQLRILFEHLLDEHLVILLDRVEKDLVRGAHCVAHFLLSDSQNY